MFAIPPPLIAGDIPNYYDRIKDYDVEIIDKILSTPVIETDEAKLLAEKSLEYINDSWTGMGYNFIDIKVHRFMKEHIENINGTFIYLAISVYEEKEKYTHVCLGCYFLTDGCDEYELRGIYEIGKKQVI
jgi:hypothetical protein